MRVGSEAVMSFADAAKFVGKLQGKARVALQTLHRWAAKGCRGVVLETICVGGTRCTSAEALQRFFDRLTVARGRGVQVATLLAHVGGIAPAECGDVDAVLRRAGIDRGDEGGDL